jgi:hypothetical protein
MFAADRLGRADYVIGCVTFAACFIFFFYNDLTLIGSCALNYLFGRPLEFYENCARTHAAIGAIACPYLPPTYVVFALWLYPLKLLGLLSEPPTFPLYLTYWLKALTTIVYSASAFVFYRIAREYFANKEWAKYAAAAWLTMPLAVFSQLIFSQCDIFYVFLTLLGVLMFLRGRLLAYFGIAITFKYFPAFVFLPLLLLLEKRVSRIAINALVFAAPVVIVNLLYHQSAAFQATVNNYVEVDRVYSAVFNVGGWHIYFLFALFMILCGTAYFTEATKERTPRLVAWFWLVSSILPFPFILWFAQWMIFIVPAVVLTSMLCRQSAAFMLLDLVGMFLFIATVSLAFPINVDTVMFRDELFGLELQYSFVMASLFEWFGGHSLGVFLSGFCGYLALQLVLKYRELLGPVSTEKPASVDYGNVRRYVFIGLATFVLPACVAIYKDQARDEFFIGAGYAAKLYGELVANRRFEQTFVAKGSTLKRVDVFLTTFSRTNKGDITMEVLGAAGTKVAQVSRPAAEIQESAWEEFSFPPTALKKGGQYTIRLTSINAAPGNAIGWWASPRDSFTDGRAIVDGTPMESDFAFRIGFARED